MGMWNIAMITRRTAIAAVAALLESRAGRAAEPTLISPQAPGDATEPPLTQASLEASKTKSGAPALAAAGQRRGGRIKVWATGLRMAGAATPVTPNDQWHLGSISKSFLATLVGRLVDQRRLAWDDRLGPALAAEYPQIPTPYRDATFLHLLSHRAGFADNLLYPAMGAFDRSMADERTQRQVLLEKAFALAPLAPIGAKTQYSNLGYVAAAAMIEARTGKTWQALMAREVFGPLRLESAGFGPPGRAGALLQPVGHGPVSVQAHPLGQPNSDLPLVIGPAGRIHMSLPDLVTYLAAHRDRTRLLRPATCEVLHTPHFDGEYALGWNTWPDGSFTHDGGNLLWYAVAGFNLKSGLAAAAAANDGRPSVWPYVGQAARAAKASVAAAT
jgi:CubicO group peptidase (beta-lactamase class C family)